MPVSSKAGTPLTAKSVLYGLSILVSSVGCLFLILSSVQNSTQSSSSEGINNGGLYRRDDSKKPTPVLDMIAVRIVIGIGVFAVINVVVISVHHIVQKVSKSTSTYREVEHVYSPF